MKKSLKCPLLAQNFQTLKWALPDENDSILYIKVIINISNPQLPFHQKNWTSPILLIEVAPKA